MQPFTFFSHIAVIKAKSYTLGAENQGCSKALLSRHVVQIEAYLGQTLFYRNTRRLLLTEIEVDSICAQLKLVKLGSVFGRFPKMFFGFDFLNGLKKSKYSGTLAGYANSAIRGAKFFFNRLLTVSISSFAWFTHKIRGWGWG